MNLTDAHLLATTGDPPECCDLLREALRRAHDRREFPLGMSRRAVLLGNPERPAVIIVYRPPGRHAEEMLVTH